jgi:hypothetical protein
MWLSKQNSNYLNLMWTCISDGYNEEFFLYFKVINTEFTKTDFVSLLVLQERKYQQVLM